MQPPQNINFPAEEKLILNYWNEIKPLQLCLEQSREKPKFGFYDGPPFATGLPHYGHILAGTIKDIITRFAHQNGFHVGRRFGWDCHGLPIEYEIDKLLDIKGPEDVLSMGIDKYNDECRKIAMKYSSEWRCSINHLGRWIDFDNDYKTLFPWFMESVWWVFKQLYHKGLVYKGFKVMPFSTACHTPLSNFESGLNYKDVNDPAITVSFPLIKEPGVSFLAWTTTPWTLPSNCALCVHPTITYVQVLDENTGKQYILAESCVKNYFKLDKDKFKIVKRFKGEDLKGMHYEPLFHYFKKLDKQKFFVVLADTYVSEDSGTAIVQQAPYFGEEDSRIALENGLISKHDEDILCPVDDNGRFTDPVSDFKGMYIKDADKLIIKYLKDMGRLFHQTTINHNYPFCWRSETPLIYKAVPSWFVRVEKFKENLLANNAKTYWVPSFVKEKRFANWLKDARDWAISRNRYWGTPIPLWISQDGLETCCVGSIKELEQLTGKSFKDIHREQFYTLDLLITLVYNKFSVDQIEIPSSRKGYPPLKRVADVFDCWFESGSMPYAQHHVPFFIPEKSFREEHFPADFIAEGIDQTRGWFYTLLVLGSLLFGEAPFKNLICNGLVLASDGQKMSKRKKNYPDPMEIIDKYGADALRLYLINSPVVRGDFLKFKEEHVFDILKEAFLPWYNAYRFLIQNIEIWQNNSGQLYKYIDNTDNDYSTANQNHKTSQNIMDLWILSYTNSLVQFFYDEMEKYHLYTVVPKLIKFIDNLTNWYVRFNRRRLKGEHNDCADAKIALDTLFTVIFSLCRMMAPFTPFLTEYMYQNMKRIIVMKQKCHTESIHCLMLPKANLTLIDKDIEKSVEYMQTVIELGRLIRDRKNIPIKYPLNEVVVIYNDDSAFESEVNKLREYILQELNVKTLTLTNDKEAYKVRVKAEPDHKILGMKFKSEFKALANAIKEMNENDIKELQKKESFEPIPGCEIKLSEVRLVYSFEGLSNKMSGGDGGDNGLADRYEAASQGDLLILLDVSPDPDMIKEGYTREVINRIQKLRKKANLLPLDEIIVYYAITKDNPNTNLTAILAPPLNANSTTGDDEPKNKFLDMIEETVKRPVVLIPQGNKSNMWENLKGFLRAGEEELLIEENAEIKGSQLYLAIVGGVHLKVRGTSKMESDIHRKRSGTDEGMKAETNKKLETLNGNFNNVSLNNIPSSDIPFDRFFNVVYCDIIIENTDALVHLSEKATILGSSQLTKNLLINQIRHLTESWGQKLDIYMFAHLTAQENSNFLIKHAINTVSVGNELAANNASLKLILPNYQTYVKDKEYLILPLNFVTDEVIRDICTTDELANNLNYLGTILVSRKIDSKSSTSEKLGVLKSRNLPKNFKENKQPFKEFISSQDYKTPFSLFVNFEIERPEGCRKITLLRENPVGKSTVESLTPELLLKIINKNVEPKRDLIDEATKMIHKSNDALRDDVLRSFGDLTKNFTQITLNVKLL